MMNKITYLKYVSFKLFENIFFKNKPKGRLCITCLIQIFRFCDENWISNSIDKNHKYIYFMIMDLTYNVKTVEK